MSASAVVHVAKRGHDGSEVCEAKESAAKVERKGVVIYREEPPAAHWCLNVGV